MKEHEISEQKWLAIAGYALFGGHFIPCYNPNFKLDREDFSIDTMVKQHEGR